MAPPWRDGAPTSGKSWNPPLSKMDKFDTKFSPSEALRHRSPVKHQIDLVQNPLDMSHT